MVDYRDSAILRMLVLEKLAEDRVGARNLTRRQRRSLAASAGIKGRDAAIERAVSPVKADAGGKQQPTGAEGGQRGPIYLAWDNPMAMRQTTRRRTGVVSLMVIDGGRA